MSGPSGNRGAAVAHTRLIQDDVCRILAEQRLDLLPQGRVARARVVRERRRARTDRDQQQARRFSRPDANARESISPVTPCDRKDTMHRAIWRVAASAWRSSVHGPLQRDKSDLNRVSAGMERDLQCRRGAAGFRRHHEPFEGLATEETRSPWTSSCRWCTTAASAGAAPHADGAFR